MKQLFYILISFSLSSLAYGQELSFEQVWSEINASSAVQQAAKLQLESTQEAKSRARRHWLPTVYLDAKTYQTNDPGASFFGLIQQRSLQATDFSANSINHPDAVVYTRGALGVNLPLYEGGMKSAQVDMLKHSEVAQENIYAQTRLDQYAQVGMIYGQLGVLEKKQNQLAYLKAQVEKLLKNYQLGSRSNPVGHSGLLGMKSLANRIEGLLIQFEAQSQSYHTTLNEIGLKNSGWRTTIKDIREFVNKYFLVGQSVEDTQRASHQLAALKHHAASGEFAAEMEKARYLPQVGAFAESYMFQGDRDTADGYMAGLYLRWNLFSSSDYGVYSEAQLKVKSAQKYFVAMEQKERAEKKSYHQTLGSLNKTIELLNDSDRMLGEQIETTRTLFRNGSINALQMVEVLNRRVDLITQLNQAESELLNIASKTVSLRTINLDNILSTEGGNTK